MYVFIVHRIPNIYILHIYTSKMSSSSSTSSDMLAVQESAFVVNVMRTTLANLKEKEAKSLPSKFRDYPLHKYREDGCNHLVNDYFDDDVA